MKFVVRWKDADGNEQRKEYSHEPDARKAKAWLIDRGAKDVDIAISTGDRLHSVKDKPEVEPPKQHYQPMFGDKS